MDLLTLYLIEVIPNLSAPLKVFGGIGVGAIFFVSITYFVLSTAPYNDNPNLVKKLGKLLRYLTVFSLVGIIVGNLIPTSGGIYRIIGAYYVTNIEGIEQLPESTVKAMNKFLEDYTIAE